MCGITGVYNFAGRADAVSEPVLGRMRDVMAHRGPDAADLFISPDRRVGMGFRRLSIVDLSAAGNQPMPNEDGSVILTFNGEIYNHAKIRPELEARGHRYRSRSDTETIVHGYEEYGIDVVQRLEGMFAIALWDSRRERFFLVRDRIGIKPLYYTVRNGALIYGSEIKAILQHPWVQRDIDPEALYHYLTFITTPAPSTLFKDIYKLPAGCILEWDARGNVSERQYWDAIVPRPARPMGEGEAIEQIRSLLSQAVEKRMMSDVPFGVFLSGGIDSSTNVALMSRLMDRTVYTFTVAFKQDEKYNELEYARQIAREFATNHHEVFIDEQDLIDFIPKLVFHQDEPIADPVCVPLYYVSKLARDSGTIVVQVGEGSDELFIGYDSWMQYIDLYRRKWRYIQAMPGFLRQGGYRAALPLMHLTGKGRFSDFLRRAAAGEDLFWGGAIGYFELDKRPLLTPQFYESLGRPTSWRWVRQYLGAIEAAKGPDFVEKMTYLDLKIRLPELLLMRVDKISMATSVEARVPFLDHKLVEMAMNIPTALKTRNHTNKYILKKAVEGIIPNNIIYRKKQGFGAPINEWLFRSFGNLAEETIMQSSLRRRGFFNYDYIAEMFRRHKAGRENLALRLWVLFNLHAWYDLWIEGNATDQLAAAGSGQG